jgi:pimeloyl-ACP methyl ester carboxylesterase
MASFVLVPGAWLGGWAWQRVAPHLEASGHTVYPVTLPGLAERAGELTPAVGLSAHVSDVMELIVRNDLRDVILVGHSYAGAVVGGVARRLPGRVRAQVYLDTMPLEEGSSLIEGFSPAGRSKFEAAVVNQRGTRVWPMPEPLGAQAPVEGLTQMDLSLLRIRGTPHPALTFEERLSGPVEPGPYPRSHAISCVESDAAAATEKAEFLSQHPDWTYSYLPICHWPMLSSPRDLFIILDEIAQS